MDVPPRPSPEEYGDLPVLDLSEFPQLPDRQPDPADHGGQSYTPEEIALGYGTSRDPRFSQGNPLPGELDPGDGA